ncbi:MAG: nickel transporter [Gammaproteobacteria bacterium]|nr:nickel transporter [Gammaproteobacteria bacterium]
MDIIPVIDLKGGLVVHAKRGERDNYRPLATPLANSAVPRAVVDGILSYRGFTQLYIADLDAIAGGAPHGEIIHAIATRHADVRVWLDAGLRAPAQLANLPMLPNIDYVLGSESMSRLEDFHALCAVVPAARRVLSLDNGPQGERLGCARLFDDELLWPARVIHMTLARVGSGGGPDFEGLAALRKRAPHCAVYAAGGVRDETDIHALAADGVAGALVATALHEGRITIASA